MSSINKAMIMSNNGYDTDYITRGIVFHLDAMNNTRKTVIWIKMLPNGQIQSAGNNIALDSHTAWNYYYNCLYKKDSTAIKYNTLRNIYKGTTNRFMVCGFCRIHGFQWALLADKYAPIY